MKRILVAAALLAVSGMACGAEMALRNQGGGQIVLTGITCPHQQGKRVVYAYVPDGRSIGGCWMVDKAAMTVIVRYADGTYSVYPAAAFRKIGGGDE